MNAGVDFTSQRTTPLVLIAGGTIGMTGADNRHGSDGEHLWPEALSERHSLFDHAPDSSCFRLKHWQRIVDTALTAARTRPIIITHGTDTLEQTAFLLSLLGRGRLQHPVILTGAWTPPDQPGSDAARNLLHSLRVAVDPHTPPGVYVVIGNEIHHGARVKKVAGQPHNIRGIQHSYFESVGGPVGLVLEDKVFFPESFEQSLRYYNHLPTFFPVDALPKTVKIKIKSHGNMSLPSHWFLEALAEGGKTYTYDHAQTHPLLDPIKASLKLGMLLAIYNPKQALTMMDENIVGEHSNHGLPIFSLPHTPQRDSRVQVIVSNQFTTARDIRKAVDTLTRSGHRKFHPNDDRSDFHEVRRKNPILQAIATAVRQGVDVVMTSNAIHAATDLQAYHVGRYLKLAGARDSGGLTLQQLLIERPDHPRLIIIGTGSGHLPLEV